MPTRDYARYLLKQVCLIALGSLGILTLYAYPPETTSFYPRCPIYAFTGLLCPGCGATRALAALLHLHFTQAWQANSLIVILIPLAAAYLILARPGSYPARVPSPMLWTLLAVCTLFTLARNFPPYIIFFHL